MASIKLLDHWTEIPLILLYSSLKTFSKEQKCSQQVITIVNIIINDYFQNVIYSKNDPKRIFHNRYNSLLNLPFHNIRLWKDKTLYIIYNWEKKERNFITNVIYSYRAYPLIIIGVCRAILENWKTEIKENVYQIYGEPNHGDHIRLAMGHPDIEMRKLIKKTAKEIIWCDDNKEIVIPAFLLEIAKQIVIDNKFPEWVLEIDDEKGIR